MTKGFLRKNPPVTFSFTALMAIFAQRTLFDMNEELDLLYWLTGESIGSQSVTEERYKQAQTRLMSQFKTNFSKMHFDIDRAELDGLMQNTDDSDRNENIRMWLIHMAARAKMDHTAYYAVKRSRCKKK